MRHIATIALLLIAGLLGGLAVTHSGGKYWESIFGEPALAKGEILFQSEQINQVRNVTLTGDDGAEATFKFIDNTWQALSPWNDRADSEFVRSLITFTNHLEVQEVIPRKDLELEDFGLRKGSIQVTMSDQNGEQLCAYQIGRTSALHIQIQEEKETITVPTIFIRQTDRNKKNSIYICSNSNAENIHVLFKNKFARFRDHHPFSFAPRLLDEVRVQSSQGEVVLSNGEGKAGWGMTKPLSLRTEPQALINLFNKLAQLTAIQIEDRANVTLPTAEENNSQAREISMKFKGAEESVTLTTYPPEAGATYALATVSDRPDVVFQLPINETGITSLTDLELDVNDLRAKTLLHMNGKQLSTIVVRPRGKESIFLKREVSKEWQVLRHNGWAATNIETLSNLILAATQDKIQNFVTDAATDLSIYGLDKPMLEIGFAGFNKASARLAISRGPLGKKTYAYVPGTTNVWEIGMDTLSKIATDTWKWRTSFVWHVPKMDISQIVIEKRGEPATQIKYEFFTEKWKATREGKDITAAINPNRANTFLANLESVATSSWRGPYDPQAAKLLETPNLVIRIHIALTDDDGNKLPEIVKSLSIASSPNKLLHFAKVNSVPATQETMIDEANYFLLDPEIVEKLSVNLFK